MTTATADGFRALVQSLPPRANGDELVLRDDLGTAAALLRPEVGSPRNFELVDGAARELQLVDDDLPAARLAADPTAFATALAPHLGSVQHPVLVAWRPRRRAVVRVLCDGETWFVKLLDRKTWKRAQVVFAGIERADAPLALAAPKALLPDLCGYAVPAVVGTSLREHLARGRTIDWPLVDAATAALARTKCKAPLPRLDFAEARDAAVKMLRKAVAVAPRLEGFADLIAQLPTLPPRREGLVHGDYHDKQLFLADGTASLIDLEGLSHGDADFDLVNLSEHLRLRALQQNGCDDGTSEAMLDRVDFPRELRMPWQLCVRARLCGVYAMRPRWAHLTDVLLSEVDVLLSAK